jgi:hypothetical protein
MSRVSEGKTVWITPKNGGKPYRRSIFTFPSKNARKVPNDGRALGFHVAETPVVIDLPESSAETDAQIGARIKGRMQVIDLMATSCIEGNTIALIIGGPSGLGKTFEVRRAVEKKDPGKHNHVFHSGFSSATGVYKALYAGRNHGQLTIFDDMDTAFKDQKSINLFKGALDTTAKRSLSWLTETRMETEEGELVPRTFEFEGSVIFITNFDLDLAIAQKHPMTEQFNTLISRSHYINMGVTSKHDYIVRLRQVVYEEGMLSKRGFNKAAQSEIMNYIEDNQKTLRELTLRCVIKVSDLYREFPNSWRNVADITVKKAS